MQEMKKKKEKDFLKKHYASSLFLKCHSTCFIGLNESYIRFAELWTVGFKYQFVVFVSKNIFLT